jgi:hypothetical protein
VSAGRKGGLATAGKGREPVPGQFRDDFSIKTDAYQHEMSLFAMKFDVIQQGVDRPVQGLALGRRGCP